MVGKEQFYGRLVSPRFPQEFGHLLTEQRETAVFNAAVWQMRGQTYTLSRVMTRQQVAGVTDTTARFDIYTVAVEDVEEKPVAHALSHDRIPVETIKGNLRFNPEDARAFVLQDSEGKETEEVLFGLTAVDASTPYPAFFKGRYPFKKGDFTGMEVLDYLPPGKNLLPLSESLAIYRPEFGDNGESVNRNQFSFIKRNTVTGKWDVVRTIVFPDTDWVGESGRYGLTGGVKIPTETPGVFRMIIHGFKRVKDESGREVAEYALGLGEFKEADDRTFDVVAIDNEPLLTYPTVLEHAGEADEPDAGKRVIYSLGYALTERELLVPVTIFDKEIVMFGFSRERVLQSFTKQQQEMTTAA